MLKLGDDGPSAQNNWQVYSPNRAPGDIPPGILASFDLEARSVGLEKRVGNPLIVTGSMCFDDPSFCTVQPDLTLQAGQKANFDGPVNFVIYRGGTVGCHITLYDKFNEQADGKEVRIVFTAVHTFSVGFNLPTNAPHLVRSVGYFC
ncbi:hypothetical protein H2200_002184 [Cladophialophora chaetospira]|uniref:Uncharacterized protein n=1 Tax=Cladophialophora chaetospira TaxID=386627 RepID=A0AA39CN98_9EURO|nr:hypothetical protein H2200_002184 [Cladophialophora chaetospira]